VSRLFIFIYGAWAGGVNYSELTKTCVGGFWFSSALGFRVRVRFYVMRCVGGFSSALGLRLGFRVQGFRVRV
jgi:hypothetical protein